MTAPKKRSRVDTSSDSESEATNASTTPPPTKKKSKKHVNAKKSKGKKHPKKSRVESSSSDSEDNDDPHEPYLVAARAITRCVNLFCNVSKTISLGLILSQEEAAQKGELVEDESSKERHQKHLAEHSPKLLETYKREYEQILHLAPGLRGLINDPSKVGELSTVLSKMTTCIGSTRSNDATRLKVWIGHYAAPNPSQATINPPIYTGSATRSHLGVNHPVLARMICPALALELYDSDPIEAQKQLADSRIEMIAAALPAILYAGDPPGKGFNKADSTNGLFKGYLLERVMRHVFTGPSTALGGPSRATRTCNAILHDMRKVRFGISAKNKWSENDGPFNYRAFYFGVIAAIRDCKTVWAEDLLKWWNQALFKNEAGRLGGLDTAATSTGNGSTSPHSMDLLSIIRAQTDACAAENSSSSPPLPISPPPTMPPLPPLLPPPSPQQSLPLAPSPSALPLPSHRGVESSPLPQHNDDSAAGFVLPLYSPLTEQDGEEADVISEGRKKKAKVSKKSAKQEGKRKTLGEDEDEDEEQPAKSRSGCTSRKKSKK